MEKMRVISESDDTSQISLDEFLHKEYGSFFLFAASRVHQFRLTQATPEDLVQTTILNLLNGPHHEKIFIKPYVFTCIAHTAYHQARKEIVQRKREAQKIDDFESNPLLVSRASEQFADWEEQQDLEQRLEQLDALIAACLEEAKASKTIRKMLAENHGAEVFAGKPREYAPELGISPRSLSTYLTWIRRNIFPCVKRKFENLRDGARQDE
jgi:hypothetical protein